MYKIKKLLSCTNCVIDFAELVCKLTILKIHASAEACMGQGGLQLMSRFYKYFFTSFI